MSFYRINFLITGLDYGGAEVQLVNLATELHSRGWDIGIISIMPPRAFTGDLSKSGIPVVSLGVTGKNPLIIFRAYIELLKILHSRSPQILHCHLFHANLLGRMTRIFYRTPVSLSTIQSIYEGGKIRDIAYRLSDPLTDLTTICSDVAAGRFIRIRAVPEQKLRVIPNGIDIAEFIPNPEIRRYSRQELKLDDHFAWLAVGRLEVPKDYPCLLHAFAIVARRHPNALLLIAGQGSLRPDLENLANELGLSKTVRFLGLRKDVQGLMNAADAFVMSSAWEGMPIALLESSSTALPMVATDVGGNREVVVEGVNGFLAPPQSATALANSMLQMMELPDTVRRRMGEAGRKYVEEHYSLKCIVNAWETLYLELLRKKGLV